MTSLAQLIVTEVQKGLFAPNSHVEDGILTHVLGIVCLFRLQNMHFPGV